MSLSVIGTLQVGGARGLWKTPNTHTTLTNVSGAVNTEEALGMRGNAKEKRQESGEGLTERAPQGEDTTKTKTN